MQRVYNLGFFEDVSVKILPGKEDPNNIIMELTVIENVQVLLVLVLVTVAKMVF